LEGPTISVIIPTYNNGHFIRSALESIFKQTYPGDKIEIIVVDDGSTDNTYDMLNDYMDQIIYIYQEQMGIAAARNRGIALSKGKIITFLDSDDVWLEDRISRVIDKFKEDNKIGIVYHPVEMIDRDGRIICKNFNVAFGYISKKEGWITNDIISGKIFCGGSTFSFKREVLEKVYPIPLDIRRGVDFYLASVSSYLTQAGYIPEVLGRYRLHERNTTMFAGQDNYQELGIVNRDFAYMRRRVIEKIRDLKGFNIESVDMNIIERIQAKEMIFFQILNGRRLRAIREIPSLFKGRLNLQDILKACAVSFMALFVPRFFYTKIVKIYGLIGRMRSIS